MSTASCNQVLETPQACALCCCALGVWAIYRWCSEVLLSEEFLGRRKRVNAAWFWWFQVAHCGFAYMALHSQLLFTVSVTFSTVLLVRYEQHSHDSHLRSSLLYLKHLLLWAVLCCPIPSLPELLSTALCACCVGGLRASEDDGDILREVVESVPAGVAIISAKGNLLRFNRALGEMMGLQKPNHSQVEAALRHVAWSEQQGKGSDLIEDVLQTCKFSTSRQTMELGTLQGGTYGALECSATYLPLSQAFLICLRDSTPNHDISNSPYLRSISHELRTPLNAIINLAQETLDTESLSPKGAENCKVLLTSAHFLLSTVNDLLDLSRLSNAQFKVTKQTFNLKECLRSCMDLIEPQCRTKKLDLKLRYDSLLPEIVYTDPNRLKQVILNLLSNALKFTLRGSIEVVAVLVSKTMMRISVTDTGIGIAKDAQAKVLTMFGKLDGNEKLNPQGCGLGLSISNSIVQGLGGDGIHVKSVVNEGSIFSFEVHITPGSPFIHLSAIMETVEYTEDIDEHTPKVDLPATFDLWREPATYASVLVADDSEFNRIVLTTMLKALNIDCDEAVTGAEAVQKVRERGEVGFPYALVLMDLEMPELMGIEAVAEIRKLVEENRIEKMPVVVGCSAYDGDREKCISSGMLDFLEKPISKAILSELITRLGFL